MISDSFPTALILKILLRLPAKSIARFHCVSKLWASMLSSPHFKELFLTRSSAQPRLLFAIETNEQWSFFSLPQHQSPCEKSSSSLVVAADFHMKFPPDNTRIYPHSDTQLSCGYASGLIYFYGMWMKQKNSDGGLPVICNPITGRYAALPYLHRYKNLAFSFFGFDPIDKQFKVLFMAYPFCDDDHKILTLGIGKMRWRKIKCSLTHQIVSEGICINGILYYLGDTSDVYLAEMRGFVIVCFDVRSEKFKFIYPESFCQLINYKGKLGLIYYDDAADDTADDAFELRVWVLEDVEKQEWSKNAYTLRDDTFLLHTVFVVGVTATSEIVLSMGDFTSKQPYYIFYFNPERNTLQRVEIQGFGEYHEDHHNPSPVYVFDHVEDLNVNDPKLLKSSIYAPYVKTEEGEEDGDKYWR